MLSQIRMPEHTLDEPVQSGSKCTYDEYKCRYLSCRRVITEENNMFACEEGVEGDDDG
jgi:hypothetical protein